MPSSLEYLLNRLADNACTPEEREELMQSLQRSENDAVVRQLIDRMIAARATKHTMPDDAAGAVLQTIFDAGQAPVIPMERKTPLRVMTGRRMGIAATAILVFLLGAGVYFRLHRSPEPAIAKTAPVQRLQNDIPPGGNKAVLTLGNGSAIVLDSAHDGMLAQQGDAKIVKTNNGQLAYNKVHDPSSLATNEPLYNTLATPRGGQYQLVLPDGSKVWLNAASSIRYPTAFTGKERKVEITGEAYLEVAKSATMPFVVKISSPAGAKGEVIVLGTAFNVNAYDDEPLVRTTLVQGAVLVRKDAAFVLLAPGRQAQLSATGQINVVNDADMEEVLAWKNGLFSFKGTSLEEVMRQIARWYDIKVTFKGPVPTRRFGGKIYRNAGISGVLEILEESNVHYQLNGKEMVIMP